ncbi:MAG TPA: molybdenum ABC transporter ATP-binding protein [Myxococcota bacterium]
MSGPPTRIAVRMRRGDFALDVDVGWNERVAVIFGPSGSGKTTLFETVLGLHPAARPTVRLGGMELDDPSRGLSLPPERRDLGWVPQDPTLFPHLSVEGNLRFGLARAGARGEARLAHAAEVLGIEALRHRRVDELSGGERQRVAIARALASGPRALVLDEPLASLDLPLRARVLPYLMRVRDELDLPILYITHDPDEALLVGEVVAVMDAGRVVATGPPREVLWSRAVLPLSEALGLENVLEARVEEAARGGARVRTGAGLQLSLPAHGPLARGERVCIGLRAQDILIAADPPGRISARNVMPARVVRCESEEDGVLVHLDAGERLVAKITAAAAEALALAPGAAVHLVIKAQALRRVG